MARCGEFSKLRTRRFPVARLDRKSICLLIENRFLDPLGLYGPQVDKSLKNLHSLAPQSGPNWPQFLRRRIQQWVLDHVLAQTR